MKNTAKTTNPADDLTMGLKVAKLQKLTGAPFDKNRLAVSNLDLSQAFNEDKVKKENFNGDDENLEKEIFAELMKDNDYFKKFA